MHLYTTKNEENSNNSNLISEYIGWNSDRDEWVQRIYNIISLTGVEKNADTHNLEKQYFTG